MVNETYVTIRGYAGGDPAVFVSEAGRTSAYVRVGVTHRIYDRANKRYSDGVTVWYSVRTYGELATNVASSVAKGTPVLARGRLSQRVWTDSNGVEHAENCVFADSLGVELSTGMAQFTKVRSPGAKTMPTGDMSPDASSAQEPPAISATPGQAAGSASHGEASTSYTHAGPASYAIGEDHAEGGESIEEGSETSTAASASATGHVGSRQLQEV